MNFPMMQFQVLHCNGVRYLGVEIDYPIKAWEVLRKLEG